MSRPASDPFRADWTRRGFLRAAAGAVGALALPDRILADPYAPLRRRRTVGDPVRVRGRVRTGGGGLGGVAVSDGLSVVGTDADGRYELLTTSDRPFVQISVPAGHRIPTNPSGTARFYEPLRPDGNREMEAVFDLEPLEVSDERHTALVLPDPQTEDRYETGLLHETTVPDLQATAAATDGEIFGVACGDIMFDNLELYPEWERAVERSGVPFFQVVGNHDLDMANRTDEASTETFTGRFGPRYYSFDRGAVHYVVLDDVFWHGAGYLGYLGRDQLRWLEADLARLEPGRTVIVALHIPVLGTGHVRRGERRPGVSVSVTNRQALYRLLEPFRAHVVCGHTHENDHHWAEGVHEHVCGTVCGAWWSGPICADGTPNGYGVYEIDGEEVTWRHKSTGEEATHQMRLYAPGADPSAPDELVANVWDHDEAWTVVWYEGADRRGALARRVGLDPLSAELHTGPDLPERRSWVEPYPRWLFYAPASPDAREVTVEATDRFGRAYVESIRLG